MHIHSTRGIPKGKTTGLLHTKRAGSLCIMLIVWFHACIIITTSASTEQNPKPIRLCGIPIPVLGVKNFQKSAGTNSASHLLVQFKHSISPSERKQLEHSGISFQYYIYPNAYLIYAKDNAWQELGNSPLVIGTASIPAKAKIDPQLRTLSSDQNRVAKETASNDTAAAIRIDFFPDIPFETAREVLAGHSVILSATQNAFDYAQTLENISLPADKIQQLAEEDSIRLISKIEPIPQPQNYNAQLTSRIDEIHPGGLSDYNLDGSGVTVGIWESGGVRVSHEQLVGRAVQVDTDSSPSAHGTHVAGTIAANGSGNPAAEGMAPNVSLLCWNLGSDLQEMYENAYRIDVSNHSYGLSIDSEVSANNSLDNLHKDLASPGPDSNHWGIYTARSESYDQIVYEQNIIAVVAAGNYYGTNGSSSTTKIGADFSAAQNLDNVRYNSLSTLGSVKNTISVGAVDDLINKSTNPQDILIADFSGWGPTDDGRIKPDIVANGVKLLSLSHEDDNAYSTLSGTSTSAPVVTGAAACLVQQFRNYFGGANPSMATMKSLLIHTAMEAGPDPGPDYQFGWGLLNARAAADFIRSHGNGGSDIEIDSYSESVREYNTVYSGQGPIKITIVWTDASGYPVLDKSDETTLNLVNDLDLILIGPDGTRHYPWTLDPENPSSPPKTDRENYRDNVEQIVLPSPLPGSYIVQVSGQVNLGQQQAFTLCCTGLNLHEEKPELLILSPFGDGTVSGAEPLRVSAKSTAGLTAMDILIDDEIFDDPVTPALDGEIRFDPPVYSTIQSAIWDTANTPFGTHSITITITDTAGETYQKQIRVLVDNSAQVIPIAVDAPPVDGRIWPKYDKDFYSFQVPDPGFYKIETLAYEQNTDFDTVITLYGPGGESDQIATDDDNGEWTFSKIIKPLVPGFTYTVKVEGCQNNTGAYRIRVDHTEEPEAIQPVPIQPDGTDIHANMEDPGIEHWYSFQAPYFGIYTIQVAPYPSNARLRAEISLFDSRDPYTPLLSSGNQSQLEAALYAGDVLWIRIRETSKTAKSYTITVSTTSTTSMMPLSPDGNPVEIRVIPGQAAWCLLTPITSGAYFFHLKNKSRSLISQEFETYKYSWPDLRYLAGSDSNTIILPLEARERCIVALHVERPTTYTLLSHPYEIKSQLVFTRYFSLQRYNPGETVTVTILINAIGDMAFNSIAGKNIHIQETLPHGWVPKITSSYSQKYDSELDLFDMQYSTLQSISNSHYIDAYSSKFTYQVVPPADATETALFSGTFEYDLNYGTETETLLGTFKETIGGSTSLLNRYSPDNTN